LAIELARGFFLREDNYYGCAESRLVALQTLFGLPNPEDSSAAMALNGGIAYSGGVCGAVAGAALAVGRLADRRIPDHQRAKLVARRLTQQLMDEFRAAFSSTDCRDLIDYEISVPSEHRAFIESGVWRDTCMRQIEFSVGRLASLADSVVWEERIAAL
jgi:C_GCAxxG_C_C family probable redox protein